MTSAVIFSYTDLICFAGGINKSEVNFCNVSRSEMPRKSCHGHGSTEKTAVSNIVLHGFPLLAIHFFHFRKGHGFVAAGRRIQICQGAGGST